MKVPRLKRWGYIYQISLWFETIPKIFPNIFVKIEGENKPSQTIPGSIVNDVIDLEKGHFDEVVYLTPIDP